MKIESYTKISEYLSNKKFKNIFLITGKNSYYKSGANKVCENLFKSKNVFTYFKNEFTPKFHEIKVIQKLIENFEPNLILAIGGGTVIDYAKCVNCLNKKIKEIDIISNTPHYEKKTELCAIPTTAGSGAEVTENAVLYINEIKYSVENKLIKPDKYFLVPEFVVGSDKKLKASSGFDAIAQAIESIISLRANEVSLNFSKKSLSYSLKNFESYYDKPDLLNANQMCLAANLSGKAISITKTTAPHAISYPFTSHFNISHGHAVSLTLSKFLKFNFINLKRAENPSLLKNKFDLIFNIFNAKSITELCNYLESLKKRMNMESNLKKLNINLTNDIDKIISGINMKRLKNNPIEISIDDIKKILKELI